MSMRISITYLRHSKDMGAVIMRHVFAKGPGARFTVSQIAEELRDSGYDYTGREVAGIIRHYGDYFTRERRPGLTVYTIKRSERLEDEGEVRG